MTDVRRVGIRELRAGVAAAVRSAEAGERLVVTVDGRPVAQLGPIEAATDRPSLEQLAAAGLVVPPRRRDLPDLDRTVTVWAGTRVDRLLRELRG